MAKSKHGRNMKKCKIYNDENKRIINKKKKLERIIKKHPEDKSAIKRLKEL